VKGLAGIPVNDMNTGSQGIFGPPDGELFSVEPQHRGVLEEFVEQEDAGRPLVLTRQNKGWNYLVSIKRFQPLELMDESG
jgi:hypothetical protein